MKQKLIIFIKYPEAGKVKTRLAKSIGGEEAASIYRKLAEETVDRVRSLDRKSTEVVLAYDPPERERDVRRWLKGPFQYWPQGPGDLGARLARAAHAAFGEGAQKVVIIGSDCPDLDSFTVERAFRALDGRDTVLGPSEDGGYYLIGLSRASQAFLFDGISWGTGEVLAETLEKMRRKGGSCEILPEKFDVDMADDLKNKISVIVPAFNEEENIEKTLLDLAMDHAPYEIIVADGGSADKTADTARRYAKVVGSPKGRAAQMNAGAAVASGDIFLFLHADTKLPPGALSKIRRALRQTRKGSGRFRMSFGHPHPLLRFYECQTRFHFFSYGDQAFFVTREMFGRVGGFRTDVPFEDIDFYRRLLKIERPVILKDAVVTSPRRFLQNGIVRQKLINIFLASMYWLGFKAERIRHFQERWYGDIREQHGLRSA